MKEYTGGLLFDELGGLVTLLLKNRPERQKGLYNLVGGKVEKPESPHDCMVREAQEEIGVTADWKLVAFIRSAETWGEPWGMYVYKAYGDLSSVEALEDQAPEIFAVDDLPDNIMPNLRWLIPMALNIEKEYLDYFQISEQRY